jgi:hypothetical protein
MISAYVHLQSFIEHYHLLGIWKPIVEVRLPELKGLDGLIMPGRKTTPY